jgi:uncharacterized membrane protein (UPF0136 family)
VLAGRRLFSLGYLLIAIVDVAVLAWAARLCLRYRTSGVIFASFPLLLVWFDNLVIGLGSALGEGHLLQGMNAVRFVAHFISLPMGFVAVGAMAREAGFAWAQPKWVMAVFCLATTGFIAYDLWQFFHATLYPACFADTLRYTTQISAATACSTSADIGAGKLISPAPAIILTVTVIAFGIYLWVKTGWKWLLVMSGASMLFFAIPMEATGGIVANIGEPVFIGAIVATAAHIAQGALTRRA